MANTSGKPAWDESSILSELEEIMEMQERPPSPELQEKRRHLLQILKAGTSAKSPTGSNAPAPSGVRPAKKK